MKKNKVILIGYSGHAFVVFGILTTAGYTVSGYCDKNEKELNPFSLKYYGSEQTESALKKLHKNHFFISIGDNATRRKVYANLFLEGLLSANAIHPSSVIHESVVINKGVMISSGVNINPLTTIGTGVICNTGCIIEHECKIGDFAHIAPGAVLCGNVHVGENSFIGAASVVRENIIIGKNVMVGAGSVVVKDIPDNTKVAGNPAIILKYNKR